MMTAKPKLGVFMIGGYDKGNTLELSEIYTYKTQKMNMIPDLPIVIQATGGVFQMQSEIWTLGGCNDK